MDTDHENPSFGPLEGLIGTWKGVKGWSVIAVPARGSTSDGAAEFDLIVQNYTEILTFKAVDAPVENKGGSFDQIIGAIEYEQRIHDFDTKALIHVENGMLMYLDVVTAKQYSEHKPPFSIARSGTIPHGNSVLVLGDADIETVTPTIFDINTHPKVDPEFLPENFLAQYVAEQDRLTVTDIVTNKSSMIFNVVNPNENLRRDNHGLAFLSTLHIGLDSDNQGQLGNIPFLAKHAKATRFTCDFWLEKIRLPMSKQTFDQLQYSQTVDIAFNKDFSDATKLIKWPHVTVNTLTKQ